MDSPNAFAISKTDGNLTVSSVVDTIVLGKTVWNYKVNVSNPYVSSTSAVIINVLPVPRPPIVFAQVSVHLSIEH